MRKVWLLAMRDYKASVKTKGFIIGLILVPLMMGGGLIVLLLTETHKDISAKNIVVIDRSGIVADAILSAAEERNLNSIYQPSSGKQSGPAYMIEKVEADTADPLHQQLVLSDQVRTGELQGFVIIDSSVLYPDLSENKPYLKYYSRNPLTDEVRDWLAGTINSHLRKVRLADHGVDTANAAKILVYLQVQGFGLVEQDSDDGTITGGKRSDEIQQFIAPLVLVLFMFMTMLTGVGGHLYAVMEEKSQRIYEVMLGSVRPFYFMLGKLIGGLMVSLTTSAVYIGIGAILLFYSGYFYLFPVHILPWFLLYLICGNLMIGSIATAMGSACNDAKDAQNMNFPVMLPAIFPLFFITPLIKDAHSTLSVILSLFPVSTPTIMFLRQAMPGEVPVWQIIVAITGMLLTTLFLVWLSARIFRVGILMQGKAPKFGEILKWAFRK